MPFADFEDWDECIVTMTDDEGHSMEEAENICGALRAESKADNGDPDALLDALQRGAGLIADVGVDLVSGVDVPAVNSKWTMLKSEDDGHDWRADSPILLSKADDSEKRISYAAAMIPREPDKEGDVVGTPTVEKAAHDFLKSGGGVDTDHSLIDGDGEPVESWVLKEERTFDLPGGGSETYGAGTWMLGIEWGADAWDRIKSGELTGLSIYGMAEVVELSRSADACPHCGRPDHADTSEPGSDDTGELSAAKSDNGDSHKRQDSDTGDMGDEPTGDDTDGGDGPTIGEVASSVSDLSDTVESLKDAVQTETEKDDAQEAAAMLAEQYDMGTGDVLDVLSAADGTDPQAAVEAIEAADDEDEDEDDDGEMEASADDGESGDADGVEKRADDAELSKGSSGEGTRQAAVEKRTGDDAGSAGVPSYASAAKQREGGN